MKRTPARISQLIFLALFLTLFVQTEYRGHDDINAAVNAFFRVDPLVLFSYLLAAKSWTWLLLPAVLMVVATLLLAGMAGGMLLAVPMRFRSAEKGSYLLRPPGVLSEGDFLKKCVRCGECMKVCLKSALYPAAYQAGLEGIYTPPPIPQHQATGYGAEPDI